MRHYFMSIPLLTHLVMKFALMDMKSTLNLFGVGTPGSIQGFLIALCSDINLSGV